ncbi:hypothetical protein RMATCC62417_00653 [Rhizopus microsporus]|nr:hypothetical protein RMATCC62417_00653 [Rhizopus microsporus]
MILTKTKKELTDSRFRDRWCSKQRRVLRAVHPEQERKALVMFMGDRGIGIGSTIKGYRRYGGQWKQNRHSKDVAVCITNEHKTSQTCTYCFGQLRRPTARYLVSGKTVKRRVKATFTCFNRQCILWQERRSCQTRDTVSAAAIALSSLTMTLFGETLPPFNPKIS